MKLMAKVLSRVALLLGIIGIFSFDGSDLTVQANTIQTLQNVIEPSLVATNSIKTLASGTEQLRAAGSHGKRADANLTNFTWHTSEEYVAGNLRVDFYLDSLEGDMPEAFDIQLVFNESTNITMLPSVPITMSTITKVGGLELGLLGSAEVPAHTCFWNVSGAAVAAYLDGTTAEATLATSRIELTNNLGQLFPEYIDPLSLQDAGSMIWTDWAKLASSPTWNGRDKYKTWYNATYGTQTDEWWAAREIHHIRPRIYGGTDDNTNLMPVETAAHHLITTWFLNY